MTYSIVARDAVTGEVGALLASYYYGCAPRTLAVKPGVGVVVMQMVPEMDYGLTGLTMMSTGNLPDRIVDELTAKDPASHIRQVAMMNVRGHVAAFTGSGCIPFSGHQIGKDCSVQGAMVATEDVWKETVTAFESSSGSLPERMIAAMQAGERAGGDIRGRRAAAMLVVAPVPHQSYVRARPIDIRIDDHPDPLHEVSRHLGIQRLMSAVELAFEQGLGGDVSGAITAYEEIARSAPDDPDVTMRYGMMLAAAGRIDEAKVQLEKMESVHGGWRQVTARLISSGMLPDHAILRNLTTS